MAETLDFTHFPLERKAWRYLTTQGENRPPFRKFVRYRELVHLASSLRRQITLKEITAFIQEDVMRICRWPKLQELVYLASPLGKQTTLKRITALIQEDATMLCDCHKNGGKFMGVRRLVTLPQGKRLMKPKPLNGIPKSLWPLIKTRQGLPVISGTVCVEYNEGTGEFITIPLCGALLFLMRSKNGDGMPVEAFNEDTHLGSFRHNNQPRHTFSWESALSVICQHNMLRQ